MAFRLYIVYRYEAFYSTLLHCNTAFDYYYSTVIGLHATILTNKMNGFKVTYHIYTLFLARTKCNLIAGHLLFCSTVGETVEDAVKSITIPTKAPFWDEK